MSKNASATITTIVCCVEFGRLEHQTVMMVRSIRAFGGAFADAPVIAVIGRFGAPLRKSTTVELQRLGVKIVKAPRSANPATWFNYGNKAAAVVTAEKIANTDQLTWLDSDILIIEEPRSWLLSDGNELAITLNNLPPKVTPDDLTHMLYWRRLCALFDVDFDDIPWVNVGGEMQKPNCNSGVFTWRRGSGFAEKYRDGFRKVLDARLAQSTGEFFTVDQVILVPLAHGKGWKAIDFKDHTFVASDLFAANVAPFFDGVRVLHYSTSPYGQFAKEYERRLADASPKFFDWLSEQHFDPGQPGPLSRGLMRALRGLRGIRYKLFARNTVRVQ